MKENYHTHTYRCMHARGSDEEYVQAAIKAGIKVLGFSDHCPWHYRSSFVAGMRMKESEFANYYQSIKSLQAKYQDQIMIKIGLECEYFEMYIDWLEAFAKKWELDYLILGNHYYKTDENHIYFGSVCDDDFYLKAYVDETIKGMETGLFTYLAHPDLFMRGRYKFDDFANQQSLRLCKAAKKLNIPLEYNLEGARVNKIYQSVGYPHPLFWDIVKEVGNKAIIGYDAHNPRSLLDDELYNEAMSELNKRDIEIIDHLSLRGFKNK